MTTCSCCNKLCETLLMVKTSFKNSCVDLSSNEVRTLNANKGYDQSCIACRAIGSEIKDLKSLIRKLQDETTLVDQNPKRREIEDRTKRKYNLIIFGLDEPNQNIQNIERMLPLSNRSAANSRSVEFFYFKTHPLQANLQVYLIGFRIYFSGFIIGCVQGVRTSDFKVYVFVIRTTLLIRHIQFLNIVTYISSS